MSPTKPMMHLPGMLKSRISPVISIRIKCRKKTSNCWHLSGNCRTRRSINTSAATHLFPVFGKILFTRSRMICLKKPKNWWRNIFFRDWKNFALNRRGIHCFFCCEPASLLRQRTFNHCNWSRKKQSLISRSKKIRTILFFAVSN